MADKIKGFRLGDRVRFTAVLERDPPHKHAVREWYSVVCCGEGVVVGHRVVKDGKCKEEWDSDGPFRVAKWTEFVQTGATSCLLVATDMRKAHIRVPFNAVTKIPTPTEAP